MTSEEYDKSDSAKSPESTVEDATDGSDPGELSNDQDDFSNVEVERAPDTENAGASEAIDTSESTAAKQDVNEPTVPPRIVPTSAPKNRLDEFWQSAKAWWGNLTWPGDWLLFASGADHQWFRDNPKLSPEEKRRFRTQGLIVCLTATFSGLGALYLFTSLFADVDILPVAGTTFAILFAFVWGVLPSYRTLNEKVQVRVFYVAIWAVYSAHRSKASERE